MNDPISGASFFDWAFDGHSMTDQAPALLEPASASHRPSFLQGKARNLGRSDRAWTVSGDAARPPPWNRALER